MSYLLDFLKNPFGLKKESSEVSLYFNARDACSDFSCVENVKLKCVISSKKPSWVVIILLKCDDCVDYNYTL